MSTHRHASARPRRSGRTRALLSLGVVAALATGMSVKGTFAFWTDSATATTGTFSSGTLDLTVNGALAGAANNGSSTVVATLAATNLVPGESIAVVFPVKNEGSTPLTYGVTATGAGALAVTNGLRYAISYNVAATNTGTAAANTRVGSCGGVVANDTNTVALTATSTTLTTSRSLVAAATDSVCIVARLDFNAPNTLQDKSGTASFVFDAKQVGA